MNNLEMAERIKKDLGELLYKRGNKELAPALLIVEKFIERIRELQHTINSLEQSFSEVEHTLEAPENSNKESTNVSKNRYGLTTTQVAHTLGVSVGSIRRWCDMGHLEFYRTPGGQRRFSTDQLEQFLTRFHKGRWGAKT